MTIEALKKAILELEAKQNEILQILSELEGNPLFTQENKQAVAKAQGELANKLQGLKEQLAQAEELERKRQIEAEEAAKKKKTELSASVGYGGKNLADDVALTLELLTKRYASLHKITYFGGSVKGQVGNGIQDLQRRMSGKHEGATGVMFPGDKTFQMLVGTSTLPPLPPVPKPEKPKEELNDSKKVSPIEEQKKTQTSEQTGKSFAREAGERVLQSGLDCFAKLANDWLTEKKKLKRESKFDLSTPIITPIGPVGRVEVGGKLAVEPELSFSVNEKKISGKVKAGGSVFAGVHLGVEFSLFSQGVALTGGLENSAGVELAAEVWSKIHPQLVFGVTPMTGDLSLAMSLVFTVRCKLPGVDLGSWVTTALAPLIGATADGDKLKYTLGKLTLLELTSPSYAWTMQNITTWSYKSEGQWSFKIVFKFDGLIVKMYEGMKKAVTDLLTFW